MKIATKLNMLPTNIIGKPVKYDRIKVGKIIEVNSPTQGFVTIKIDTKYCKLLRELIRSKLVKTQIKADNLLLYSEKRFPQKIKEE